MKPARIISTLVVAASVLACSLGSALPSLPFGSSPTPSNTSPPPATFTPTPSPTPIPAVRVVSGDQALFLGDFDRARSEYSQVLLETTDPALRAESLWGLGRTDYEARNYDGAIAILSQLITEHPQSDRAAQAYFLLGDAYTALGRYPEAAGGYANYLAMRPGHIDSYALEYQGNAYFANQSYVDAFSAYNSAASALRLDDGISLQIKIAQTHAALGDYANALALYDSIYAQTTNDYVKAQMDYLAGSAKLLIGQSAQAHERFLHAVENYPLAYESYLSLVELVNAGIPVSDYDRGLVDFYAAQYDVALAAFDRYLAAGLDTDGNARFYRARSLQNMDRDAEAIDEYSNFINSYVSNDHWAEAWKRKAQLQWIVLDDNNAAAQTLQDFVSVAPGDPLAGEYLMYSARILERDDQLERAARTWERVATEYPGGGQASDAMFLAGISYYRLGNYAGAQTDFQQSSLLSGLASDQARAHFWIGKCHEKLGALTDAQASWQQAQNLEPGGYYSERARDLLFGRVPFQPAALLNLNVDLAAERVDAAAWLRVKFALVPETDLSGPGILTTDPRFTRGSELWQLGRYDEARLEFESLREAVSSSPADSYRLANYLLDLGLYRSGINAARQVLTLAGLSDQASSLQAPPYFSHVRYGLYYRELVEASATEFAIDPIFLYSVMRQESLFEGFARSTADAGGLMQIMPGTGAEIASELGWPSPFHDAQRYQPYVNMRMGAFYLADNRTLFDGDLYATLAAYNGGPGITLAWKEVTLDDSDLFLELIILSGDLYVQTRDFIQSIYEYYNIYRNLYSPLE